MLAELRDALAERGLSFTWDETLGIISPRRPIPSPMEPETSAGPSSGIWRTPLQRPSSTALRLPFLPSGLWSGTERWNWRRSDRGPMTEKEQALAYLGKDPVLNISMIEPPAPGPCPGGRPERPGRGPGDGRHRHGSSREPGRGAQPPGDASRGPDLECDGGSAFGRCGGGSGPEGGKPLLSGPTISGKSPCPSGPMCGPWI